MKAVLNNEHGVFYFQEENPDCLDYVMNNREAFPDAYSDLLRMLNGMNIYNFQLIVNHGALVMDRAFDTRIVFQRPSDVDRIIQSPPPPAPPPSLKDWADMVEEEEEEMSRRAS